MCWQPCTAETVKMLPNAAAPRSFGPILFRHLYVVRAIVMWANYCWPQHACRWILSSCYLLGARAKSKHLVFVEAITSRTTHPSQKPNAHIFMFSGPIQMHFSFRVSTSCASPTQSNTNSFHRFLFFHCRLLSKGIISHCTCWNLYNRRVNETKCAHIISINQSLQSSDRMACIMWPICCEFGIFKNCIEFSRKVVCSILIGIGLMHRK